MALMYRFVVAPLGMLIGVGIGLRAFADEPASATVAPYTEAPLGA
jgi:hypothetical protein